MNRQIKFRAWTERNGGEMIPSEKLVIWSDCVYCNDSMELNGKIKGFSVTNIMQFTGLKDKNGADIYEGDILQYGEGSIWSRFEVVWNKRYCQFELDWTRVSPNISNPSFDALDSMFLIGNIHENPELIK